MARQRSTFGKLERDRAKRARAQAKQERRAARAHDEPEAEPAPEAHDEADVLAQLERLHEAFEAGGMTLDDFEERRGELLGRLHIE